MRRIALLTAGYALVSAAVLALSLTPNDVAQARGPVPMVNGHSTYWLFDDRPDSERTLQINVRGTIPPQGTWFWETPGMEGNAWSGPVACLQVEGSDAWLAGPTADGLNAVFIFVHDGGLDDEVFVWGADPNETLDDMVVLCDDKAEPPYYGWDPFPVRTGNVTVRFGG